MYQLAALLAIMYFIIAKKNVLMWDIFIYEIKSPISEILQLKIIPRFLIDLFFRQNDYFMLLA